MNGTERQQAKDLSTRMGELAATSAGPLPPQQPTNGQPSGPSLSIPSLIGQLVRRRQASHKGLRDIRRAEFMRG